MAVISWGRPKIEIVKWTAGATSCPSVGWATVPNPKEDSTELVPTKGDKKEAYGEGGEIIDVKYKRSKYELTFELYVKKGESQPIPEADIDDGVVNDIYGIRITPEDTTLEGICMPKCSVSVDTLYTAADGKRLAYTFSGIRPADNQNTVQPYTATTAT